MNDPEVVRYKKGDHIIVTTHDGKLHPGVVSSRSIQRGVEIKTRDAIFRLVDGSNPDIVKVMLVSSESPFSRKGKRVVVPSVAPVVVSVPSIAPVKRVYCKPVTVMDYKSFRKGDEVMLALRDGKVVNGTVWGFTSRELIVKVGELKYKFAFDVGHPDVMNMALVTPRVVAPSIVPVEVKFNLNKFRKGDKVDLTLRDGVVSGVVESIYSREMVVLVGEVRYKFMKDVGCVEVVSIVVTEQGPLLVMPEIMKKRSKGVSGKGFMIDACVAMTLNDDTIVNGVVVGVNSQGTVVKTEMRMYTISRVGVSEVKSIVGL